MEHRCVMNKKWRIKIAAGCITTLGLTIILLMHLTGLMKRKSGDLKYTPFFEQEEDFDVLFLGSSHTVNGIFPMELWHDYGIISYNVGGHGNWLAASYWTMENALDYTSPELVVIDCYRLSYESKMNSIEQLHTSLDAFPISKNKIAAVFDLIDNAAIAESENIELSKTRMEFLWSYAIYHNRWTELSQADFVKPEFTKEKGAGSNIGIHDLEYATKITTENKIEEDTVSVQYLKRMIEDCQNKGIDVLLIYLPCSATEEVQEEANRVYDIAEQYGVNYINFFDMNIVRDDIDFSDYIGHLNVSGARKITDYLGEYILENYHVADQRENIDYTNWNIDYTEYVEYKLDNLKQCESLDNYLMLLADKNYSIFVEINNPEIWYQDLYAHLLENLGVNSSETSENTDFIVIQEAGKQVDYLENFHECGGSALTSLGRIDLFMAESGTYYVYLDNEEFYYIPKEKNAEADIWITVIDKDTMEIVDQCSFSGISLEFEKNE